jgi:hypothetical protein
MHLEMLVPMAAILGLVAIGPAEAQPAPLSITSPRNAQTVVPLTDVAGTAPEGVSRVWVIVHPTLTADCWVQGMALVDPDHTWRFAKAHFGNAKAAGAPFEVRALAFPATSLQVGKAVCWPDAATYSAAVNVVRQ